MQQLILIRGLPGSGKSTLAKQLKDFVHVEADMFFRLLDGTYRFMPEKLKDAHDWCLKRATEAIEVGHDVVVSNTFTRYWEMEPYLELAERFDIYPQVLECHQTFQNIHGVPEEAIVKMRARWEAFHY